MNIFFRSIIVLLAALLTGCIEPFVFDVEKKEPPLVIESYISNISYNETREYPSDGRFFTTKLRYGQAVSNRGENVSGAQVLLISDEGDSWIYTEIHNKPGVYMLFDPNFKAQNDVAYKLQITLTNDDQFESEWEKMTASNTGMSDVSITESIRYKSEFRDAGQNQVIVPVRGVNLEVELPENPSGEKKYFKWEYEAAWIYLAGRLDSSSPYYRCYVRGNSYLSQYTIAEDVKGNYSQDLVFIDVDDNHRLAEGISILVKQLEISQSYYNFLKELEEQSISGGIFDAPPYNLKTNYRHLQNERPVFGYFSVVHEQARRIQFSGDDLSFQVDNSTREPCRSAIPPYPPGDPCDNCLNYNYGGDPSTVKPFWWVN